MSKGNSVTIEYSVDSLENGKAIFGRLDENIKFLAKYFDVNILTVDGQIKIIGSKKNANGALALLEAILVFIKNGQEVSGSDIKMMIDLYEDGEIKSLGKIFDTVAVTHRGIKIRSKTIGQKKYIDTVDKNFVTFGIGPAGTGKTYLAVAKAVKAYKEKQVLRIILTRPAVEAGEKLGFLPGDMQEKVDPYLRPLYDALSDMLGLDTYKSLLERGVIEIAPLAYMRGRTLTDAFVILDEAQNATKEQMKMFLTRMGENSKMIVTGDITQIDLPHDKSGLLDALEVLNDTEGVGIVYLSEKDVVRHGVVRNIIKAYDDRATTKNV